jgi:hypothetical protein
MKTDNPVFSEIIMMLFNKTGNIEASFTSKMLATLDPLQPICDRYVLKRLNLRLIARSKQETLENAIALYSDIRNWYDQYLGTDEANECIAVFDRTLPKYQWISNVKKIDFFLWSSR